MGTSSVFIELRFVFGVWFQQHQYSWSAAKSALAGARSTCSGEYIPCVDMAVEMGLQIGKPLAHTNKHNLSLSLSLSLSFSPPSVSHKHASTILFMYLVLPQIPALNDFILCLFQ
jgi:hypothetical protein